MKENFIKTLLESGTIALETATVINEAWEVKLSEARQELAEQMRAEYANKYEHDKNVMVEALDKMVTDGLATEIAEFQEERKAINEDRVKAQQKLRENAQKFNEFMVTKLAEEIKELRADRKTQMEGREKLEQFVVKALAREIREFNQDKQAVVEAKVKLVAEAKAQLNALKQKFVAESAKKVSTVIGQHLKGEISQLKEDIKIASENNFGRRLFEAYAAEFSTTYLNEKSETRKLMAKVSEIEQKLVESTERIKNAQRLVESKEREVRMIKDNNLRERTMSELLGTLNEEKAEVMRNLLESVQTTKLKVAFDKYLPAVLNTVKETKPETKKQVISETREVVTGDKTAKKVEIESEEQENLIAFKRLAGL